ncbi:MAG: WecB/TagA/CpsF family glycosyltransferase [Candidatus Omnitrophica bacterium]|nr:WecB/TagA/CpsF family glycosyltransferase [Candidatus Omnitrophota bacterium]
MDKIRIYDVLGVHISAVDPERAAMNMCELVKERAKGYVCVAPVSTIVDAKKDPGYCEVVNAAAMVTPDGAPVAWLGLVKGFKEVRRTYGPEMMLRVCNAGQALGIRHFFYGATEAVCAKLVERLTGRFPGILVVGVYAPPFTPKASLLTPEVARMINEAKPDIVWVGLGAPKQDIWMALNRSALDAPVLVGIGAAFDFHAGVKPQAPQWMGRAGLEWLFRLCSEPHRLWKRYLIGNTLFIYWIIVDAIATCFMRRSRIDR